MFEPQLLLSESIAKANIHSMAEKCRRNNILFRPHFKTHQSSEIGEWFRNEGIDAITCSSFKMAQYFAEHNWQDITVAITANSHCIDDINKLSTKINLNIVVESIEVIQQLEKEVLAPVGVFVKIDVGYHRTGVDVLDFDAIKKVMNALKDSKKLIFIGFLTHAGNTYKALEFSEVELTAKQSMNDFLALKFFLLDEFPLMQLSWGDTPSCSVLNDFHGIDELRPGNFVFYDYSQVQIGSCLLSDIAVCMLTSIIAIHPGRNEIVVHCGAVHLSKESITTKNCTVSYGMAIVANEEGWNVDEYVGNVVSLSQEHAIIKVSDKYILSYKPGDLLGILPVHSCLTANLMKEYRKLDGEYITCM